MENKYFKKVIIILLSLVHASIMHAKNYSCLIFQSGYTIQGHGLIMDIVRYLPR